MSDVGFWLGAAPFVLLSSELAVVAWSLFVLARPSGRLSDRRQRTRLSLLIAAAAWVSSLALIHLAVTATR